MKIQLPDLGRKTPPPYTHTKNTLDLDQPGLYIADYKFNGFTVTPITQDNRDELLGNPKVQLTKVDFPITSSALRNIPGIGQFFAEGKIEEILFSGINNMTNVYQANPQELAERFQNLRGQTLLTSTLVGELVATMNPGLMSLHIKLENYEFTVEGPTSETSGVISLATRAGGLGAIVTGMMMSPGNESDYAGMPSLIGAETGPDWEMQRDLVHKIFKRPSVKQMTETTLEIIKDRLEIAKNNGGIITLDDLKQTTLDLILGTVMGVQKENFSKYARIPHILERLQNLSQVLYMVPITQRFTNKEYLSLREELFKLMNQFRIENPDSPFIQALGTLDEETGEPILPLDRQLALLAEIFVAGQETTANGGGWAYNY